MGKLNEIAQKAYECAVRRGKIDPDNDSNNNLHRDLLEEVAEVFECTGEATTIFTAICLKKLPKSLSVRVRNLHILKSI